MQPVCFYDEGSETSLLYISQASTRTESNIFARLFSQVFAPELWTRTGKHVYLISDHFKSHFRVSNPRVTLFELPPNTTAVYQLLSEGVIAALNLRYNTWLLQQVLADWDQLILTGQSHIRTPQAGCLDKGDQGHLLNTANIIVEECDYIS